MLGAAEDVEQEDEDDEVAPLLADTRHQFERFNAKDARLCFKGLPWIVALCVFQVVLVRAETALQFPYLRSLQRCSGLRTPGHEWSGSDFCGDRGVVTRLAQAETNYVQGLGMVVHCLLLPLLGWLADRCGRKPLLVLNFGGLLVEAVLNALFPRIDVLFLAVAIQMGTNGLTPALLAMIADATPPERRLGAYLVCGACAAPAYALVYLAITHYVLAEHLHAYAHTWGLLALVAAAALLVAVLAPETLQPHHGVAAGGGGGGDDGARDDDEVVGGGRDAAKEAEQEDEEVAATVSPGSKRAEGRRAEAVRVCSPLRLLMRCCGGARGKGGEGGEGGGGGAALGAGWHGRAEALRLLFAPCGLAPLRFVMLLEVPLIVSLAAFSTLDGFALIAYQWEQETMYYARLSALPAAALSVLASYYLMREPPRGLGPLRTLQLGALLVLVANLVGGLAQWHPALLLLALALCAGAGLGLLPVLRLLSAQVGADQQAGGNAVVLAVATGARACGLALHAVVFKEAAAHGVLNATFVVGAACATAALLIAVALPPPPEAWRVGGGARAASAEPRARRDD